MLRGGSKSLPHLTFSLRLACRMHVTGVTDDRRTDHAMLTSVSIAGVAEIKAGAFSNAAVSAVGTERRVNCR